MKRPYVTLSDACDDLRASVNEAIEILRNGSRENAIYVLAKVEERVAAWEEIQKEKSKREQEVYEYMMARAREVSELSGGGLR